MNIRECLLPGQSLQFQIRTKNQRLEHGDGLSFQFWLVSRLGGHSWSDGGLIYNVPDIEITQTRDLDGLSLMVCEHFEKNNIPLKESEVDTIRAALHARREFVEHAQAADSRER